MAAEEATVLDEVTNGYVPWSTSNNIPWAPSNNIFFFFNLNSSIFFQTGLENFKISGAILSKSFFKLIFFKNFLP